MSGRIIARGRVISITPELRRRAPPGPHLLLPRDKEGAPVPSAFSAADPDLIPARSLKGAVSLYDREEKIGYRCVAKLDPLEGWAPTEFWQARWKLPHKAIVAFVEKGYLDAAVEQGSQVRRYRCRDEWALLESPLYAEHRRPKKKVPRSAGKWRNL